MKQLDWRLKYEIAELTSESPSYCPRAEQIVEIIEREVAKAERRAKTARK